jgi:MFS family permease
MPVRISGMRLVPTDPLVRRLALSTLINRFGSGLFMTTSALFFTRSAGLSVGQVGLGLTIAGGCGVAASIPAGHAADRFDPRKLFVVLAVIEAAGMLSYTRVHSVVTFLPAIAVVAIVDQSSSAVRNTLIAVGLSPERRTPTRAYLRVVTNLGIGAGAAVAALALQADTRTAYLSVIVLNALTFLVAAGLLARLPLVASPDRPDGGPRLRALTDLPYLTVTGLNAVLTLQFGLLEVGLPLWIAGHTHAPRMIVSVVFLLTTTMIVLLQVHATRRIDSIGSAGRAARRSGLLLGLACLVYAFASGATAWVAAVVLITGGVVQTFGEMISAAAGWTLSYDLAAPDAPGAYQGVFNGGFAASQMVAPLVVTTTAIHLGRPGWLILAAVFVGAGAALVPASRWAIRTRTVSVPA